MARMFQERMAMTRENSRATPDVILQPWNSFKCRDRTPESSDLDDIEDSDRNSPEPPTAPTCIAGGVLA
eukprot:CAMPEP_0204121416 /NCGR_PEP_ID=MMETSP0361-20130328/8192_1 /ASSEMBLY_ACC=CAM_ASM_000343 /TAXON_ID=268821 /ORGANISM="Scrippsiella Hangoei, Strain SHTV-5" /LENGTH=68 /DNA_ID=CAMNT_0051072713 /DNA_START=283 /DNA_END=486 /DNA_ORIENTATION=-